MRIVRVEYEGSSRTAVVAEDRVRVLADVANTLGPWIVAPDELERYRDGDRYDLDMRATIDGAELGNDTLANMAWSFEEMVASASTLIVLRPGDLLPTGSPAGDVRAPRQPLGAPRPRDGGREITGLRVQRKVCVRESSFEGVG
jgi:hypothetical protein